VCSNAFRKGLLNLHCELIIAKIGNTAHGLIDNGQ
jgi:hypothetical protein